MKKFEISLKNFYNFKKDTKTDFEWNKIHLMFGINGAGKTHFSRYFEKCLNKKATKAESVCKDCAPIEEEKTYKIAVFNKDYLNDQLIVKKNLTAFVFKNTKETKEIVELDDKIKLEKNFLSEKLQNLSVVFEKEFAKKLNINEFLILGRLKQKNLFKKSKILKYLTSHLQQLYGWNLNSISLKKLENRLKSFLTKSLEIFEQEDEIIKLNTINWTKNDFTHKYFKFSQTNLDKAGENIKKILILLEKNTTNQKKILEKLFKIVDFRIWIKKFFELHKKHKKIYNSNCPLCSGKNTLDNEKIKELLKLNQKFQNISDNDEIDALKKEYARNLEEFKRQINENKKLLESFGELKNDELKKLKNKIKKVETNLDNFETLEKNLETLEIQNLERQKTELSNDVKEYWKDFKNTFLEINTKKGEKIFNCIFKRGKINDVANHIKDLIKINNEILKLEKKKTNIKSHIEKDSNTPLNAINNYLSNFFSLDIRLFLDRKNEIYKIQKKFDDKYEDVKSEFISEGEKMIISLIYFQTKLSHIIETDFSTKIVVIDDPSSSLTEENKWNIGRFLYTKIINKIMKKKGKKMVFILSHDKSFLSQIYRKIRRNEKIITKKSFFKIHKDNKENKISCENESILDSNSESEWEHLKQCLQERKYVCIGNLIRKIQERFPENSIETKHENDVWDFINQESHISNLKNYLGDEFILKIIKKWSKEIKRVLPVLYEKYLKGIIKY